MCRTAPESGEAVRKSSDGSAIEGCNLKAEGGLRDSKTILPINLF
jgi:hypothetical protein